MQGNNRPQRNVRDVPGNDNQDDVFGRIAQIYSLPKDPNTCIPKSLRTASFYSDGYLAFGLWLPSIAQMAQVDRNDRNRFKLKIAPAIIMAFMRVLMKLFEPYPYTIPLAAVPDTVWMYNTFLVINNLFREGNIGPVDLIRTGILPLMFVINRASPVQQETRERLDALAVLNAGYMNVAPDSPIGLIIHRLVQLDRRVHTAGISIFSHLSKQRFKLEKIGAAAACLRIALVNAGSENHLERRPDTFARAFNSHAEKLSNIQCLGEILDLADLAEAQMATKSPLSIIVQRGHLLERALALDQVHLENAPAGVGFFYGIQIEPRVFLSSAMLKASINNERLLAGGIAVDRAHGAIGDMLDRNAGRLDMAPDRNQNMAVVFGDQVNLNLGQQDIAHINENLHAQRVLQNLIFGDALEVQNQNPRPLQPPEEMFRVVRDGENHEQFLERRAGEVNQERGDADAIQLQVFNPNGMVMQGGVIQMMQEDVPNINVQGLFVYSVMMINTLVMLIARAADRALLPAEYIGVLTSRNRDEIAQLLLQNNPMLRVNLRDADHQMIVDRVRENREQLSMRQIGVDLGLPCLPRTPTEYTQLLVAGMINENYPQRLDNNANQMFYFECPLMQQVVAGAAVQSCFYFNLYNELIQNNRYANYQGGIAPAFLEPFTMILTALLTEDQCDEIELAFFQIWQITSGHQTPLFSDISYIAAYINSFFGWRNRANPIPYSSYSAVSIMFTLLSILVVNVAHTLPVLVAEYPMIWTTLNAFNQVLRVFAIDGQHPDLRNNIPLDILPVNQRNTILPEFFYLANIQFLDMQNIAGRLADRVAAMPAFNLHEQVDLDHPIVIQQGHGQENELARSLLLNHTNRRALKASTLYFE